MQGARCRWQPGLCLVSSSQASRTAATKRLHACMQPGGGEEPRGHATPESGGQSLEVEPAGHEAMGRWRKPDGADAADAGAGSSSGSDAQPLAAMGRAAAANSRPAQPQQTAPPRAKTRCDINNVNKRPLS